MTAILMAFFSDIGERVAKEKEQKHIKMLEEAVHNAVSTHSLLLLDMVIYLAHLLIRFM